MTGTSTNPDADRGARPSQPGPLRRSRQGGPDGPGSAGGRLSHVFPLLGAPGGYALVALYAATGMLAVAFGVAFFGAVVDTASDGRRAEPTIRSQFRWQAPPELRLTSASSAEPSRAAPRSRPAPARASGEVSAAAVGNAASNRNAVVRGREEEKLRRAAGILLLDGDYEGAMELLLQIRGEDSRAFALDRAAHTRILGCLREEVFRERKALGTFCNGLSRRERSQLLGRDEQGGRAALEEFLALPPERLHLPQCAAALPEKLALCFVRNVHVRLARATGGSDTLLALVLGLAFRQDSDAARVYWESFPADYVSYDEVLPERNEPRRSQGMQR